MIGSLFSGIGGLELGLEWAGLGPVAWQVEIDSFCRTVLAKHWPNANRSVNDVREASAANLAPVDVICGGFPCQDVSSVGEGAGLAGKRSGLWYEYLRVVTELRPRLVVVENVASGKSRWLCEVRSGLHALGYDTAALQFSARDVGAPHRRERVFVVAHALGVLVRVQPRRSGRQGGEGQAEPRRGGTIGTGVLAHADRIGCEFKRGSQSLDVRASPGGDSYGRRSAHTESRGQPQPAMGRGPDGLPAGVDVARWPAARGEAQHAWEPPRTVAERIPERTARLKALGNAVVPHVALEVGRWITANLVEG